MFIDANIFLEIFLKDKNYERCKRFILNLMKKNAVFYTSDFVVYSCMLIIYNKLGSVQHLRNFLIFINSIKISVIRPGLKDMFKAAEFIEKYKLDFDDALVVGCMTENGIKELASYDCDFDKVKEINVFRP